MEPGLRLLLVAINDGLAAAMGAAAPGNQVALERAERAAEAVRRFDAVSPDGVLVAIGAHPEQAALLLQALRDRPLGALIPIGLVDQGDSPPHPIATPSGAAESGADRFFAANTPPAAILATIAEMLGIHLDLPLPDLKVLAPLRPASTLRIERDPVGEHENYAGGPRSLSGEAGNPVGHPENHVGGRDHLFDGQDHLVEHHAQAPLSHPGLSARPSPSPLSRSTARPEAVTAESIRRKVRQARHEDYFTLLEVRRGADELLIEESYRQLRGRYEPSRLPRPLADRHFSELREVCDAFDDAFAVLSDEDLRNAYLRGVL